MIRHHKFHSHYHAIFLVSVASKNVYELHACMGCVCVCCGCVLCVCVCARALARVVCLARSRRRSLSVALSHCPPFATGIFPDTAGRPPDALRAASKIASPLAPPILPGEGLVGVILVGVMIPSSFSLSSITLAVGLLCMTARRLT